MSAGGRSPGLIETADPGAVNVALGKAAVQSSVDVHSRSQDPAVDAAGAVSGTVSGDYGFHTAHEHGPWWQVDLGSPHLIQRIVVHNRTDQPALLDRALPLELWFSDDDAQRRLVDVRGAPFGGGEAAYRWLAERREQARFVRLRVPRLVCLHLDEVEVFATPWRPTELGSAASGAAAGYTSMLGQADPFETAPLLPDDFGGV